MDMSIGEFLRSVWPTQGYFCVAELWQPDDSSEKIWTHKIYDNVSAAVSRIALRSEVTDVFYAVLSLREEKVPSEATKSGWSTRIGHNMLAAKVLFFDLDVGSSDDKYSTQAEAFAAVKDFTQTVGLPRPTVVSSGGGLHVYWHFDRDLLVDEWQPLEASLKGVGRALGLKFDPMRTTDSTSVLRPVGTKNWKKDQPRPVTAWCKGEVSSVDRIRQVLNDAVIRHGVTVDPPRAPRIQTSLGSNTTFEDFAPPTLAEVVTVCAQMRDMVTRIKSGEDIPNPLWYKGLMGIVPHVEDGANWAHKLTEASPRDKADVEEKLAQVTNFPPSRCDTLASVSANPSLCDGCRFKGQVPNPLTAARRNTPAPAPVVETTVEPLMPSPELAGSVSPVLFIVPDPPEPWKRLKTGGIAVEVENSEGEVTTRTILHHDLYPKQRLTNRENSTEQQVWCVTLPLEEPKDFLIDADALYDLRKFASTIANQGIFPHPGDLQPLKEYMTAYIQKLQKEIVAEVQHNHLGWIEEHNAFVLTDRIITTAGEIKPVALSRNCANATHYMSRAGTIERQRELLGFYQDRRYWHHHILITAALASPWLYATGQNGVVINATGESGASKSTGLYTAASLWGNPKMLPLNATSQGATERARLNRMTVMQCIPTMVDEATHMQVKDVQEMVMAVTQPGYRVRLDQTGVERRNGAEEKSGIMLSTANTSLHSLLATNNQAGTAGSMRVIEMLFEKTVVHTKPEADEFLIALTHNYGHIGPAFMERVVPMRLEVERRIQAEMREFDIRNNIQPSERFVTAGIVPTYVIGQLAYEMGFLPFDPEYWMTQFEEQQLPYMRGVVVEEYSDPLSILTDYIETIHGNIIHVTAKDNVTSFSMHEPRGSLLGHYDKDENILYLLKKGFRDYCMRVGANPSQVLRTLKTPMVTNATGAISVILADANCRITLGRGTHMAKAQSWCFALNMSDPRLSGQPKLGVIQGGVSDDEDQAKTA